MQVQKFKKVYLSKLTQSKLVTIPNNWVVKKFSDIAEINPEVIGSKYPHKEILYVDIGAIDDFQISEFDVVSKDSRPSRAQRIIQKNDVIVSTVRPYLKGFAKIKDDYPNMICSTGFAVIRAKISEDSELIFQFVKGKYFETNIFRQMDGLAYPAVNSSIVGNSLISYSQENAERNKICSVLSDVDNLIQKNNELVTSFETLRNGLIQQLLTKGIGHKKFKKVKWVFRKEIEIPEEWEFQNIRESSKKLVVGFVGTCEPFYTENNGIPMLRTTNVSEGKLDLSNLKYVTKEFHENNKKSQVYQNDLLVSRHGENGESCLVRDLKVGNCLNIVIIRSKEDILLPNFFELAFNSNIVRKQIGRTTAGGVQGVVNTGEIAKVNIVIPSINEQKKISSIISNIDSKIIQLESKKSNLKIIKKGLVQKLLTGQIRVKV